MKVHSAFTVKTWFCTLYYKNNQLFLDVILLAVFLFVRRFLFFFRKKERKLQHCLNQKKCKLVRKINQYIFFKFVRATRQTSFFDSKIFQFHKLQKKKIAKKTFQHYFIFLLLEISSIFTQNLSEHFFNSFVQFFRNYKIRNFYQNKQKRTNSFYTNFTSDISSKINLLKIKIL